MTRVSPLYANSPHPTIWWKVISLTVKMIEVPVNVSTDQCLKQHSHIFCEFWSHGCHMCISAHLTLTSLLKCNKWHIVMGCRYWCKIRCSRGQQKDYFEIIVMCFISNASLILWTVMEAILRVRTYAFWQVCISLMLYSKWLEKCYTALEMTGGKWLRNKLGFIGLLNENPFFPQNNRVILLLAIRNNAY